MDTSLNVVCSESQNIKLLCPIHIRDEATYKRDGKITENVNPLFTKFMKILASYIAAELTKEKHCAVYEPELTRVWPSNGRAREAKVALFAEQNGWRLRFYKDGFCAIFDKEPSR